MQPGRLGIGNVDEKKEVRQILKYIQGGRKEKEDKPEEPAATNMRKTSV